MKPQSFSYVRLVKSEDLNHHRTLFAGRSAEWFVEAAFIAAASALPPENIVCLKIHGLEFTKPIRLGEIAHFESKIVYVGRTSLKVYVSLKVQSSHDPIITGFITFIHVDPEGKPIPHHLSLDLLDQDDIQLNKFAAQLR